MACFTILDMMTELKPAAPPRRVLAGCGRPSGRQLLWAIVFFVSLGIGLAVLRHWALPVAARYLVPVIPLFAGAGWVLVFVRDVRRQMDELQLRIYMEAAAVAVCGLFVLMLSYPLLQAAHLVGPLDHTVVLALIVVLGIVGYIGGV